MMNSSVRALVRRVIFYHSYLVQLVDLKQLLVRVVRVHQLKVNR